MRTRIGISRDIARPEGNITGFTLFQIRERMDWIPAHALHRWYEREATTLLEDAVRRPKVGAHLALADLLRRSRDVARMER